MGTKNYGFYTEDNSATKFKEWRKKINGSDGSNIVMIDNILGEKGDKSTIVTSQARNIILCRHGREWSQRLFGSCSVTTRKSMAMGMYIPLCSQR